MLRSLGSVSDGGRTYAVVTFADQDGSQIALHFDARSGLLARVQTLRDDGVDGDMTVTVAFGFPANRSAT
ncbi:MAG: hypothetical protein ACT4P6_03915 [Gemmatimonadaceae bacterium]